MRFHTLIFSYRTNSFRITGSQIIFLCPFFPRQSHFYILTGSATGRPKQYSFQTQRNGFGPVLSRKYCEMTNPLGTLAAQVRNYSGDYRKCSRFHRQTCNQSNRCGQNISNSNPERYHQSTYKILELALLNGERDMSPESSQFLITLETLKSKQRDSENIHSVRNSPA
jgi:hypothetical protein